MPEILREIGLADLALPSGRDAPDDLADPTEERIALVRRRTDTVLAGRMPAVLARDLHQALDEFGARDLTRFPPENCVAEFARLRYRLRQVLVRRSAAFLEQIEAARSARAAAGGDDIVWAEIVAAVRSRDDQIRDDVYSHSSRIRARIYRAVGLHDTLAWLHALYDDQRAPPLRIQGGEQASPSARPVSAESASDGIVPDQPPNPPVRPCLDDCASSRSEPVPDQLLSGDLPLDACGSSASEPDRSGDHVTAVRLPNATAKRASRNRPRRKPAIAAGPARPAAAVRTERPDSESTASADQELRPPACPSSSDPLDVALRRRLADTLRATLAAVLPDDHAVLLRDTLGGVSIAGPVPRRPAVLAGRQHLAVRARSEARTDLQLRASRLTAITARCMTGFGVLHGAAGADPAQAAILAGAVRDCVTQSALYMMSAAIQHLVVDFGANLARTVLYDGDQIGAELSRIWAESAADRDRYVADLVGTVPSEVLKRVLKRVEMFPTRPATPFRTADRFRDLRAADISPQEMGRLLQAEPMPVCRRSQLDPVEAEFLTSIIDKTECRFSADLPAAAFPDLRRCAVRPKLAQVRLESAVRRAVAESEEQFSTQFRTGLQEFRTVLLDTSRTSMAFMVPRMNLESVSRVTGQVLAVIRYVVRHYQRSAESAADACTARLRAQLGDLQARITAASGQMRNPVTVPDFAGAVDYAGFRKRLLPEDASSDLRLALLVNAACILGLYQLPVLSVHLQDVLDGRFGADLT